MPDPLRAQGSARGSAALSGAAWRVRGLREEAEQRLEEAERRRADEERQRADEAKRRQAEVLAEIERFRRERG
ncbi:hypothetical protein BE11_39930 [Sorangium cellulosum]|nr:hypothetical protein BE11_39930 [Sorangium cellulosum]